MEPYRKWSLGSPATTTITKAKITYLKVEKGSLDKEFLNQTLETESQNKDNFSLLQWQVLLSV